MGVRIRQMSYACAFGNENDQVLRRVVDGADLGSSDYQVSSFLARKARRQLSRSALLAVDATRRIQTSSQSLDAPVFFACSTGREVVLPFLRSLSDAFESAQGPLSVAESVLGGRCGGNVVEYLRFSSGTLAGHVAKYSKIRGDNACFAGRSASLLALRKAVIRLERGLHDEVVVVGSESLDEAEFARRAEVGGLRELAVAVRLGVGGGGPRLALSPGGCPGLVPSYLDHFEAISALANLAIAYERLGPQESIQLSAALPTGHAFTLGVEACAGL